MSVMGLLLTHYRLKKKSASERIKSGLPEKVQQFRIGGMLGRWGVGGGGGGGGGGGNDGEVSLQVLTHYGVF